MQAIIIPAIMFIVTFALLTRKGYYRMLWTNLAIIAAYMSFLGLGAASAEGWDGIGWLLAMITFGGIHLLVLFIMALALPDKAVKAEREAAKQRVQQEPSPRVIQAMQQLPAQDRARIHPPQKEVATITATPENKGKVPDDLAEEPAWNARQKSLMARLDSGESGELPFD